MDEVLSIEPDIRSPHATELKAVGRGIEFDGVWFRAMTSGSWTSASQIAAGECVAIVGPTGAGKSTILQLLLGLYDIDRGEIRIDGRTLDQYTQRSLRETIAAVPQRPFLFVDTVAENIAFGRPFSMEEIQDAAVRVEPDEFIRQLPQGYRNGPLPKRAKPSGWSAAAARGIRRALLKRASILIMDEATSALDGISEQKIRQATDALRGRLTQILVTHRLLLLKGWTGSSSCTKAGSLGRAAADIRWTTVRSLS